MKKPGFIDGLIFAFLVSLAAALAGLLLGGFIDRGALFTLVMLGSALAYLVYLLKRGRARTGRVVTLGAWALLSAGCWILQLPLFEQLLLQAGFIWLARALYFHSSLFSALLDLGLVSAGLAAGSWAMLNTGSLTAAIWSFFLLQALFIWIPGLAHRQSDGQAATETPRSSFQSAHRVALDAVRRLTQP